MRNLRVTPLRQSVDLPFATRCLEPNVHAPRENATIVMLARNSEVRGAIRSIESIERQFNRWFHYPIIFLNDVPWETAFIDALTPVASGEVKFDVIDNGMWGFPEWMDLGNAKAAVARQKGHLDDWKPSANKPSMFFNHPALKPYKWYWRVEPDVEFLCSITYDPFVMMSEAKKVYGYTMALWERGETAPSLFYQVTRYKEKLNIPSSDLWKSFIDASWAPFLVRPLLSWLRGRDSHGDGWNWCHYWSNFEIADMDWFRSKDYMGFFSMLDELGGFYFERWGDAPVHSLGAALLLQPEQIHWFEDIGYLHEVFQTCPANALGGQLPESSELGADSWDKEQPDGIGCRCQCSRSAIRPPATCSNALAQSLRAPKRAY
ncbi:hypothetical protein MMC18_003695 [Xylographa bjoerkii]|nr:hypothetical protein [Xylographa bjoerkii]